MPSLSHGHSIDGVLSPTYISWSQMKARCLNPKNPRYKDYGGRGISICLHWMKFENFLADMGERPPGTSLNKINNNGDYEPDNCNWATSTEQAMNKRVRKDALSRRVNT